MVLLDGIGQPVITREDLDRSSGLGRIIGQSIVKGVHSVTIGPGSRIRRIVQPKYRDCARQVIPSLVARGYEVRGRASRIVVEYRLKREDRGYWIGRVIEIRPRSDVQLCVTGIRGYLILVEDVEFGVNKVGVVLLVLREAELIRRHEEMFLRRSDSRRVSKRAVIVGPRIDREDAPSS
jgi:hypothetical protein